MATTVSPGRRFFGDAGSLRSFHGNGSSSNPPSLRTRSLKAKKSLPSPMPSLLGLKRGVRGTISRSGIKNKDFNTAGPEPVVVGKDAGAPSPHSHPNADVENNARPQNSSNPLQRPRSKSRTIIRIISTKFRSRSPPPTSPPLPRSPNRVPSAPSDFASKENREAALRERGLLPPLKPNKDLSLIEREQDRHIPVVVPTDEEGDAVRKLTAANLVKQEWEAKHRATNLDLSQRERMNTFKFGGLSSPAPSIEDEIPPATELETVVEVDTPLPSPAAQDSQRLSAPYQLNRPEASGSSSSLRSKSNASSHGLKVDAEIANGHLSATSHLPAAPTKSSSEPHLIPLPPSPLLSPTTPRAFLAGSDSDIGATRLLAASIPLPPSPGPSSLLDFGLQENTLPPKISLSPPMSHSVPEGLTSGTIPSPSHRTHSFPPPRSVSESGSESIMTPSLDASSQTMTISTLSISESSSNFGRGKPSMLKVKVHDHSIPIIVESPVEETLIKGSITDAGVVHDEPEPAELEVVSEAEEGTRSSSLPLPRTRPRGLTDPNPPKEAKTNRRKSINPFKRGQTLDPSSSTANKRLSMSASIGNIRRSVVGTLSRPKSTINTGLSGHKTFDASHLPPSPTIPTSFSDQPKSPTSPFTSPTRSRFSSTRSPVSEGSPRLRQAVSPVIHSRGTILIETNNIEDEESRRMTELAFLG